MPEVHSHWRRQETFQEEGGTGTGVLIMSNFQQCETGRIYSRMSKSREVSMCSWCSITGNNQILIRHFRDNMWSSSIFWYDEWKPHGWVSEWEDTISSVREMGSKKGEAARFQASCYNDTPCDWWEMAGISTGITKLGKEIERIPETRLVMWRKTENKGEKWTMTWENWLYKWKIV